MCAEIDTPQTESSEQFHDFEKRLVALSPKNRAALISFLDSQAYQEAQERELASLVKAP